MTENLYNYARFRYLKIGLLLCASCTLLYMLNQPRITSNGGTPLGYALGGLGAGLILWLSWLGLRKRRYANGTGALKAWVSAHIYLGLSLIIVGTLHSGFQLAWNVHSLAYALMLITIFSGVWGLGLYVKKPREMSDVLNRISPERIIQKIDELDAEARKYLGLLNPDALTQIIQRSLDQGLAVRRRSAAKLEFKTCQTRLAVEQIRVMLGGHEQQNVLSDLYLNQTHRLLYLTQLRKYHQHRFWLELWLSIHVPASIGLLVALFIHVFSVFFYW